MGILRVQLSLLLWTSLVSCGQLPFLTDQCLMCTTYGYRYCQDDENLVNLDHDYCYEFQSDKEDNCQDFEFLKNPMLCEEEVELVLRESPACNIYKPHASGQEYTYWKPEAHTLTLEPRTACGFFLYEYKAYLDIYH